MKFKFLVYLKLRCLLKLQIFPKLITFLRESNYDPDNVLKTKIQFKDLGVEYLSYKFSEEPVILKCINTYYVFFKGFFLKVNEFGFDVYINKEKDFFTISLKCIYFKEDGTHYIAPYFQINNERMRIVRCEYVSNFSHIQVKKIENGEWNSYIYNALKSFIKTIKNRKKMVEFNIITEKEKVKKEYNDGWSN